MSRSAANWAMPRTSSSVAVTPVGFAGLPKIIAFVRGVIAARMVEINAKRWISVDDHSPPAGQFDQRRITDEVRIEAR